LLTITDSNDENISSVETLDSNYLVKFSGTDYLSGINKYYLRIDNGNYAQINDLNYLVTGNQGTSKKIYVLVQDNALNQTTQNVTINFLDSLIGDINLVDATGLTDLNITIGDLNINNTFTGLQEVKIYDGSNLLSVFEHDFSSSVLDLNQIIIIKGTNSVLVNLNGQLQSDKNKTLYLTDNGYSGICVKNAPITSISEISEGCDDTNETKFTSCIGGTQTLNGITCTDLGTTIKIENLRYSGAKGYFIYSSSGSSCTPLWSCTNWSECVDGNQTRICTKTNNCGSLLSGKPNETRNCTIETNEEEIIEEDNGNTTDNPTTNGEDPIEENETPGNEVKDETIIEEPTGIDFTIPLTLIIILILIGIIYYKRETIKSLIK
jgi:hypothetical protein